MYLSSRFFKLKFRVSTLNSKFYIYTRIFVFKLKNSSLNSKLRIFKILRFNAHFVFELIHLKCCGYTRNFKFDSKVLCRSSKVIKPKSLWFQNYEFRLTAFSLNSKLRSKFCVCILKLKELYFQKFELHSQNSDKGSHF